MAGQLSNDTTYFASNVSVGGTDANGSAFGNLWVGSTISAPTVAVLGATYSSGVSASRATVSTILALQSSVATVDFKEGTMLSWRTIAASALTASAANTNVRDKEVVLVAGGASGMSIAVYSNGTVYIFNSAASAKAT